MNDFTALYPLLPGAGLPAVSSRDLIRVFQEEGFFQFSHAKQARIGRLKPFFSAAGPRRVLLGSSLGMVGFVAGGTPVEVLDENFIAQAALGEVPDAAERLDGAVVILTNNDLSLGQAEAALPELVRRSPRTVFAGWDWDNHHWLERSVFLAAHTDFYAPAHAENLYALSRYNNNLIGPVYCGTQQWTQAFLSDHLPEMLGAQRSDDPLGMHVPYSAFPLRLRTIQTISNTFPSVGFTSGWFYRRNASERLTEWVSHKSHWIIPVLNDVPIRLFDALVTGGIPIVPDSLRFLPPVEAISEEHIVFYGPEDVLSPRGVAQRAAELFERGGSRGIAARHLFALNRHHASGRLRQILGAVCAGIGCRVVG